MKFLKLLAVSAAIALTACGDDNVAAFDEPPMSSQDVSSQDPSSQGKSSSCSEATVTSSSSDANATSSSSDAVLGSSSSKTGPEMISNGSIITDGQVIDLRDGRTYKTTVIGNQVWMAENLKLDVTQYIEDGTYNNESYFYDAMLWTSSLYNEGADTSENFYPWDIAIDAAGIYGTSAKGCDFYSECHLSGLIRGICPEGFHVPSPDEVEQLIRAIGGKCGTAQKLKAKHSGWKLDNGTDELGFAAHPAGYYVVWWGDGYDGYTFEHEMDPEAEFLTTTDTLYWNITHKTYTEPYDVVEFTSRGYIHMSSLRCLRDEPAGVDWVDPPEPTEPTLPEFEYGELTDPRDGKTYRTVVVNGKTWMDQNLAYSLTDADFEEVYKLAGSRPDINENFTCEHTFLGNHVDCKHKFKIDATYCASHETACKNYGKFYDWYEASVVCPAGWRLPNKEEMFDFWDSTNPYVVYTGDCFDRGISFEKLIDKSLSKLLDEDLGKRVEFVFWTSTESEYKGYIATTNGNFQKGAIMNVRCVKD